MICFCNVDIPYYFWGVLAFATSSDHVYQWPFPVLKFKHSDYASVKLLQSKSCTFWQTFYQLNVFKIILECFRVARCLIEKENNYIRFFLTLIFGRVRYRDATSWGKCQLGCLLQRTVHYKVSATYRFFHETLTAILFVS